MAEQETGWPILEQVLARVTPAWQEYPDVLRCMRHAFNDALPLALSWPEGQEAYLVTGDIRAMWLRDSSGQLEPYLRYAKQDLWLTRVIQAVIRRQARYLLTDPYANAFNPRPNRKMGIFWDRTARSPWVFERKFSLDSLAYPLRLWWLYWHATGEDAFIQSLKPAMIRMVDVIEVEQDHERRSRYRFRRYLGGRRNALARGPVPACGLIWSGFRPSDDASQLFYNIPGQMMVAVSLDMAAELSRHIFGDSALTARCLALAAAVVDGIATRGVAAPDLETPIWAYEVDGETRQICMDDANLPSLLSAPFLFFCSPSHPLYLATRSFILSEANPYWYCGSKLQGIGSSHTRKHWVWPMAMIMEAMTHPDPSQARRILATVAASDGQTGWIHESVDASRPQKFTRPWFGWANALFAEAVLRLSGESLPTRPPLIG